MGLLSWIVFGAIAGWAASLLMGRSRQMGCLSNIFVGVLGAGIGGFVANFLGGETVIDFSIPSFGVAIVGAVILLGITGWWQQRD